MPFAAQSLPSQLLEMMQQPGYEYHRGQHCVNRWTERGTVEAECQSMDSVPTTKPEQELVCIKKLQNIICKPKEMITLPNGKEIIISPDNVAI